MHLSACREIHLRTPDLTTAMACLSCHRRLHTSAILVFRPSYPLYMIPHAGERKPAALSIFSLSNFNLGITPTRTVIHGIFASETLLLTRLTRKGQ